MKARRWSQWSILVCTMAVAIGSALFINRFREMADEGRQTQVSLAKIEGYAYRLESAEWQAISQRGLTEETSAELRNARRNIAEQFGSLSAGANPLTGLNAVRKEYFGYTSAVDHEFELLKQRKFAEAEIWDFQSVNPVFERLRNALAVTSDESQALTRATIIEVNLWSWIVFATSGVLVGSLIILFMRRSRAVHRAEVERVFLQHSNANLEARVKLRTSDLESSNQKLAVEIEERKQAEDDLLVSRREAERANEAKSEFLSRMSHEFRTPLNAIIGYAQLLEMRVEDAKTLESAESILKGGRYLLGLVNEVLDMGRIESGSLGLSMEPVEVKIIVDQVIDMMRSLATHRSVTILNRISTTDTTHVLADRHRMTQVLINVLSNAIKYNRPDGRIEIRDIRETRGVYRIEIEDTGKGISDEQSKKLFVPFERLGDHQAEGAGVGLALSQRMMKLMDGDLTLVKSNPDGSIFSIEFKVSDAQFSESPVFESLPAAGAKFRIIYIEDNVSKLQQMATILEDMQDIEFMSAIDTSMGLLMIENHCPDVMLIDSRLLEGSGFEMLSKLSADPRTANIPVIVVGSGANDLKGSGNPYIANPIDVPALMAELDTIRSQNQRAA